MRDQLSNLIVSLFVILIDTRDWLISAAFVPFFGVYGTDVLQAGGETGGTFLSNIRYNVWDRQMVAEIQKGKTRFTYTVFGVNPMQYLAIRKDPSSEAFMETFVSPKTFVVETVWRYSQGGTYMNNGRRARKLRSVA